MAYFDKISINGTSYDVRDSDTLDKLTNDINDLETSLTNKINNLPTTEKLLHVVCCGDSFTDDSVRSYSWPKWLPSPLVSHNYGVGGSGFIVEGTMGTTHNIEEQLEDANNDDSFNHKETKAVIMYGGYNDFRADKTYDQMRAALSRCCQKARTYFPSAKIICVIGNAGWWNRPEQRDYAMWTNYIFRGVSSDNLYTTVNANWWLWGFASDTVFNDDLLHPNLSGAVRIARFMTELIDGCFCPSSEWTITEVMAAAHETATGGFLRFNPCGQLQFFGRLDINANSGDNNVSIVPDARFQYNYNYQSGFNPAWYSNDDEVEKVYFNPNSGGLHVFCSSAANVSVYF